MFLNWGGEPLGLLEGLRGLSVRILTLCSHFDGHLEVSSYYILEHPDDTYDQTLRQKVDAWVAFETIT